RSAATLVRERSGRPRWAFVLEGEGKGGTRGKQGEHLSTGERTYLMPESMSPSLAATPCGPTAVSSGSVPPRSPETSLHTYSKLLIRHLPARGWARGDPVSPR